MKTRLQLAKNVAVDLLFGRQKEFLGLGDVRVDGVRLRNPQRPVVVRADTPEGIQYSRFKLQQIRRSATGVAVELRADGNNWGRTEYRDEYNQQMVELGHATQPVTDVLILHLAPAKLQLGDRQWSGFQYSFEFRSRERKIHRLWTEATWEIGGTIASCASNAFLFICALRRALPQASICSAPREASRSCASQPPIRSQVSSRPRE